MIMKFPKAKKRYCPYCKKHTDHKITVTKRKNRGALRKGSKVRAMLRGQSRGQGGKGKYSKPAVTQWKMTGKKQTKKNDFRYECTSCKKQHMQSKGFRTKRVEFV